MNNPMINYKSIIEETNSRMFNVHDEYKDNSLEQNISICKQQSRNFSVGAINITGCLNIGVMIRSACLMGAENFYIFGRRTFDKRSTVGAEKYINIVQYTYDDPTTADEEILHQLQLLKHPIIACEHGGAELGTVDATNVYNSVRDLHPMFLFGSESHGIPQSILDRLDPTGYPDYEFSRLSIPQRGVLRSFNVSAAMNIIVWDYIRETILGG